MLDPKSINYVFPKKFLCRYEKIFLLHFFHDQNNLQFCMPTKEYDGKIEVVLKLPYSILRKVVIEVVMLVGDLITCNIHLGYEHPALFYTTDPFNDSSKLRLIEWQNSFELKDCISAMVESQMLTLETVVNVGAKIDDVVHRS